MTLPKKSYPSLSAYPITEVIIQRVVSRIQKVVVGIQNAETRIQKVGVRK